MVARHRPRAAPRRRHAAGHWQHHAQARAHSQGGLPRPEALSVGKSGDFVLAAVSEVAAKAQRNLIQWLVCAVLINAIVKLILFCFTIAMAQFKYQPHSLQCHDWYKHCRTPHTVSCMAIWFSAALSGSTP